MPNPYIPPPEEAYPGLRALGDAYLASQSAREGIFGRLEYHPQAARRQQTATRITPVPVPSQDRGQQQQQQFAAAGQDPRFGGPAAQFGILAPDEGMEVPAPMGQTGGKLPVRMVVDPPDLKAWREKLFHVDDVIVLTQEE